MSSRRSAPEGYSAVGFGDATAALLLAPAVEGRIERARVRTGSRGAARHHLAASEIAVEQRRRAPPQRSMECVDRLRQQLPEYLLYSSIDGGRDRSICIALDGAAVDAHPAKTMWTGTAQRGEFNSDLACKRWESIEYITTTLGRTRAWKYFTTFQWTFTNACGTSTGHHRAARRGRSRGQARSRPRAKAQRSSALGRIQLATTISGTRAGGSGRARSTLVSSSAASSNGASWASLGVARIVWRARHHVMRGAQKRVGAR